MKIPSLRPTRPDLTDLAFSLVLVGLGVVGFDTAFGGPEAFTVGLPAVGLGVAVGYVVARWRPPLLAGAAIGLLGCVLFAGVVALRPSAVAGFLPGPDVLTDLLDGAVNGGARLITTVPPAGQAGNLLAIPYLVGFWGGFLTVVAALLVRRWPICMAPPILVLALSVLFGVSRPASLLLQGAVFGALTIGWLCLRIDRHERAAVVHTSRGRLVGGAALLGVAVLGAFVVGPNLPFADANQRYVLRENVTPPFDPSQYPSPLARYRAFHGVPEGVPDLVSAVIPDTLMTVEGLPAGVPVRFAVMDSYDGFVWRASSPGSAVGGIYQRVGDEISGAADGDEVTVRFTMGALAKADSVWIPTIGSPRSVRFTGERATDLIEAFRFNRITETAATSLALEEGDTWEVVASVRDPLPEEELRGLAAARMDPEPAEGFAGNAAFGELVATWTESASTPYDKVEAIIEELDRIGARNDGHTPPLPSGHSLQRLNEFLSSPQPQGNDEQFAAAAAFLARGIGIPARVVLEFAPDGRGDSIEIQATDARAVVEIALDGVGWVAMPQAEPEQDPLRPASTTTPRSDDPIQPPPPVALAPPDSIPEEVENKAGESDDRDEDEGGAPWLLGALLTVLRIASIPLLVIFGPALVVMGMKARRRKRRRTKGEPAERIAGGWAEVIDLAKDLGTSVPPKATRREIARFAPAGSVLTLAEDVDASIFGHAEPDNTTATQVWSQVDAVRSDMLGGRSRAERLRAKVSLTSLRSSR